MCSSVPLVPTLTCLLFFHRYGHEAKVVHFLGKVKPWSYSYDPQSGEVKGHSLSPDQCHLHPDYLLMWWRLYAESVQPLLQRTHGDAPFDSGLVDAAAAADVRNSEFIYSSYSLF